MVEVPQAPVPKLVELSHAAQDRQLPGDCAKPLLNKRDIKVYHRAHVQAASKGINDEIVVRSQQHISKGCLLKWPLPASPPQYTSPESLNREVRLGERHHMKHRPSKSKSLHHSVDHRHRPA